MGKQEEYYVECNQHFSQVSPSVRAGPVEDSQRSCNDICCIITFVLIVIFTLVIGAIMINDGRDYFRSVYYHDNTQSADISGIANAFSTQGGIIVGMFFFSIALSIAFLFLLKLFPGCMIYTFIVLIFLVFAALIVFGAINQIWWMVIVFGISILLTALMLWCCRNKIKTGILLIKVASTFLTERPATYLVPLYPLVFAIIFFVYWVAAMVGEIYYLNVRSNNGEGISKENAFIILWIIIFVFMTEFLFYVQTFLLSTACAYWYYALPGSPFCKGVCTLNKYHIGSLTFGALIITVLNILKNLANSQSQNQMAEGNLCAGICLCLVACCISCIENLIQTLNHNAVIVMSVTGESYINSAKSAFSLIFENFGLFWIVDFISDLVKFFGVLVCVGIPTLVGFLIIKYGRDASEYEASYATVSIFFLSILMSGIIISMVPEVLSCVFIFYCFDKKFKSMGIFVPNSPPAIQEFLHYGDNNIRGQVGTEQQMQPRYF